MSATPDDVRTVVTDFLQQVGKLPEAANDHLTLYAEGAGLDSLETAELSATLEDRFGTDPYSAGLMPQTLGEILAFYETAPAGT